MSRGVALLDRQQVVADLALPARRTRSRRSPILASSAPSTMRALAVQIRPCAGIHDARVLRRAEPAVPAARAVRPRARQPAVEAPRRGMRPSDVQPMRPLVSAHTKFCGGAPMVVAIAQRRVDVFDASRAREGRSGPPRDRARSSAPRSGRPDGPCDDRPPDRRADLEPFVAPALDVDRLVGAAPACAVPPASRRSRRPLASSSTITRSLQSPLAVGEAPGDLARCFPRSSSASPGSVTPMTRLLLAPRGPARPATRGTRCSARRDPEVHVVREQRARRGGVRRRPPPSCCCRLRAPRPRRRSPRRESRCSCRGGRAGLGRGLRRSAPSRRRRSSDIRAGDADARPCSPRQRRVPLRAARAPGTRTAGRAARRCIMPSIDSRRPPLVVQLDEHREQRPAPIPRAARRADRRAARCTRTARPRARPGRRSRRPRTPQQLALVGRSLADHALARRCGSDGPAPRGPARARRRRTARPARRRRAGAAGPSGRSGPARGRSRGARHVHAIAARRSWARRGRRARRRRPRPSPAAPLALELRQARAELARQQRHPEKRQQDHAERPPRAGEAARWLAYARLGRTCISAALDIDQACEKPFGDARSHASADASSIGREK